MKTEQHDPANATPLYDETSGKMNGVRYGLTKREHFAAMAMQGLLSVHGIPAGTAVETANAIVNNSVRMADLLIEALNTESK